MLSSSPFSLKNKILLWDNDGTITAAKDPNDSQFKAKIILPGVQKTMETASFNFIISGCKTPESEKQDFDPEAVSLRFINLMQKLPINAAVFSPRRGGVECYVVIKKQDHTFLVKKAHEDARYQASIGHFKKPGIGMFKVIADLAWEEFDQVIDKTNSIMIGDTWQDEEAATTFGIPFLNAYIIHAAKTPHKY